MMATPWRSKWLDWKPTDEIISSPAETELTELTKPTSVSFVSAIPDASDPQECGPLDDLRQSFIEWFDSRVWLDPKAVAFHLPDPQWCTGVTALYADLCGWLLKHEQVPPSSHGFLNLLQELCLEIRTFGGEMFVSNIALKARRELRRLNR